MPGIKLDFGQSPMTDPRSLAGSTAFHALLIILGSLVAMKVYIPESADPNTSVLSGEVDGVDNRADAQTSGGAPGEFGGEGAELSHERLVPVLPSRDPETDALLSEILPTKRDQDRASSAPVGPPTSGLGIFPGPGAGGGGGQGGGSGGGKGSGIGAGTEFFGLKESAGSFAYVIDCSGSMLSRGALDKAKAELLASLDKLPEDARFGVIFYNLNATIFEDPQGRRALMRATPVNKQRLRDQLRKIPADGATDHMNALREAFKLKPEVIFFLTDADLMSRQDAEDAFRGAGKIRVLAVEFGIGPKFNSNDPLKDLAKRTGGVYRYVDTGSFLIEAPAP